VRPDNSSTTVSFSTVHDFSTPPDPPLFDLPNLLQVHVSNSDGTSGDLQYDFVGRLVRQVQPLVTSPGGSARNGIQEWTYDRRGLVLRHTFPMEGTAAHATEVMFYDAFGRLTQRTGLASTEDITYSGRDIVSKDALQHTTKVTHDPAGRVSSVT